MRSNSTASKTDTSPRWAISSFDAKLRKVSSFVTRYRIHGRRSAWARCTAFAIVAYRSLRSMTGLGRHLSVTVENCALLPVCKLPRSGYALARSGGLPRGEQVLKRVGRMTASRRFTPRSTASVPVFVRQSATGVHLRCSRSGKSSPVGGDDPKGESCYVPFAGGQRV